MSASQAERRGFDPRLLLKEKMKDEGVRRVLVVRSDKLGDVVLTLPMAGAIKKSQPTIAVSFLVNNYTREIAERCPQVSEVISIAGNEGAFKLSRIMRREKADAV